jgi:hypothetical protein
MLTTISTDDTAILTVLLAKQITNKYLISLINLSKKKKILDGKELSKTLAKFLINSTNLWIKIIQK